MYKWKVVPLCKEQLLDVKPEDVIQNGLFRSCDVYKSGGGYDKFPEICMERLGIETNPKQFVVQLYGCHLKCPYCYVTQSGIWGKPILFPTSWLVKAFMDTGLDVFHLMGGSPALYLKHWPELIDALPDDKIFHSDLLLTESQYDIKVLKNIARDNCLYAVNIKGVTPKDYERNTGSTFRWETFFLNLERLIRSGVNFYLTFTNPDMNNYDEFCETLIAFYGSTIMDESFVIDLIDYDAIKAYGEEN